MQLNSRHRLKIIKCKGSAKGIEWVYIHSFSHMFMKRAIVLDYVFPKRPNKRTVVLMPELLIFKAKTRSL